MKRFTMSLANALMICMILTAIACSKKDNETTPDDPEVPEVPELPPAESETKSPYKIGDYYNVSGVKGAVFEISNNGQNGKIVSLDEVYDRWSYNRDQANASDGDNGMNNMNVIKSISGWKSKYPAFKWCDDKNTNGITGWYYPAINELKSLYDSWNYVEDAIVKYGVNFMATLYSSSTEYDDRHVYFFSFYDGTIGYQNPNYTYNNFYGYNRHSKVVDYNIRAIHKF
jgi:hypothetical protein